jgi:DNA-binding NarL/FixJ family response regulator
LSEEELKRVLVVHSEQILTSGIESILNRENDDLMVLSTTSHDKAALADEVESFQPDVVILDEVLRVTDISTLFELMLAFPSIRVIIVDGHDNLLHVYNKQAVPVSHSADLLSAILA